MKAVAVFQIIQPGCSDRGMVMNQKDLPIGLCQLFHDFIEFRLDLVKNFFGVLCVSLFSPKLNRFPLGFVSLGNQALEQIGLGAQLHPFCHQLLEGLGRMFGQIFMNLF